MLTDQKYQQITLKQIVYLKTAIDYRGTYIKGRPFPRFTPSRNCIYPQDSDKEHLDGLVDMGLMAYNKSGFYYVTDAGRKFLTDLTCVEILPMGDKNVK